MSIEAMKGALADAELADRQARLVVHAVDFGDAEALHHAVLHHLMAAAAAFLGGLEDDGDGAREIPRLAQLPRRTEQHGGVPVMAAGMHAAGNLARHRASPVASVIGKRVHVGPKTDGRPVALPPLDEADDAGAADAGHHLVAAEALELLGDESRRLLHVEQQVRAACAIRAASRRSRAAFQARH